MRPVKGGRLLLVAALVFVGSLPGQNAGEKKDRVPVEGLYANTEYGFSASLPNGVRGYRLAAPAPNHGFSVDLKGGDHIWVYGEYDVLARGRVEALAEEEASKFSRGSGLAVETSVRTLLAGLDAQDVVMVGRRDGSPRNYVRFVIAYRSVAGRVGIVYEIGMSAKDGGGSAGGTMAAILSSFRVSR